MQIGSPSPYLFPLSLPSVVPIDVNRVRLPFAEVRGQRKNTPQERLGTHDDIGKDEEHQKTTARARFDELEDNLYLMWAKDDEDGYKSADIVPTIIDCLFACVI